LGDVDEPTAPFGLTDVQGDGSGISEARLELGEDLCRRLRDNARVLGVTAASLCHLAWAQVLSRLSGRDDVVFGTVLFGRMQSGEGAERVPGLFINTLPVRIRLGQNSVQDSVRATHALLAQLLLHEHAPLSLAQRCSAVPVPAPLFTAVLNYRHSVSEVPESADALPSWEGIESLGGEERSNYPFILSIDDLGKGFALTAQVQSPVDPHRICGFMDTALESLIEALESAPETPVQTVEVLGREERSKVLVEWNATAAEYPSDQRIHELFEQQVGERPGSVAVVYEDQELTYEELNVAANKLAHHLRGLGVGPDTLVAICVKRGPDMLVGMLAVLKAGGAYVPLDPAHPGERLTYMLGESTPVALLTHRQVGETIRATITSALAAGSTLIDLDTDSWCWDNQPETDLPVAGIGLRSAHLAFVIYTSGSTGTPKGVMIEHGSLTASLCTMGRDLRLGSQDIFLASTTISFDPAALELFLPLVVGARMVLATSEDTHDPLRLTALMERHRPTFSQATPTAWRMLLDSGWRGGGCLKILCGGEPLPAALAQALVPCCAELWNVYGPTETTGWPSFMQITAVVADSLLPGHSAPIGRPASNTQMYLLCSHGQPVPIGVAGELHIGGVQMARGYLNRSELTAERFVPDPFSSVPGARLYKTGDLARQLPDGNLDFLGRNDFQVKLRGFRIELGEIEAALAEHAGIGEVVVLVREDVPGDRRLVAYYVAAATGDFSEDLSVDTGSQDLTVDALRVHLAGRLPEYMVPAAYVGLDRLPLTPNGKIYRGALPAPDGGAYVVRGYENPVGATEGTLARIWAELLHLERVGRHDSFFELGGHSLLVIRLVSLLKRVDIEMTIVDLFNNPTIKSLGAYLERDKPEVDVKGLIQVRPAGLQRPLFLIHEYTGLDLYFPVLAAHIDHDIPIYGLPGVPLDEPQLQTIEGIAARLVQIIRTVQPQGPYRIAGWSFGGVVAYEVAVQLVGQDQMVEFMGLLDTSTPTVFRGRERHRNASLRDSGSPQICLLQQFHDEILSATQTSALEELKETCDGMGFEELLCQCREAGLPAIFEGYSAAELHGFAIRLVAHAHAYENYAVRRIPIPVHFFAAQDVPSGQRDQAGAERLLGWDSVLPEQQIELIPVPGDHQTMMEDPNIAILGKALSHAIAQAGDSHQPLLPELVNRPQVTIQTGRRGSDPIFCVPGAGGSVTSFFDLADAVGDGWPLHGLQPRGSDGVLVPHSTVEAAASAYLGEVNAIYPEGPVHLLGHSFGGWVALEMAHQLRSTGRAVASLTVVDSDAPGDIGALGPEYTFVEVLTGLTEIMELSAETSLGIDSSKLGLLDEARQLEALHQAMVRVGLIQRNTSPELLRGVLGTFGAALRTRYRPQRPYFGPLRLVLAPEPRPDEHAGRYQQRDVLQGWRQWAPNITHWQGQGNHMTVLRHPHVQALANWWLADAPASETPASETPASESRPSDA
jgi:arthrofactin-type cyclic lipopeptide synthetase C